MIKLLTSTLLIYLSILSVACACQPDINFLNRPLAMKLAGDSFFVGEIKSLSDDQITFSVIAPGGPAKTSKVNDVITLKIQKWGTCGEKHFEVGEKWLYDGSNLSFGPSQKIEPSDLKDGLDIKKIKENIIGRLDPDYKLPRQPTKDDLPMPGVYSETTTCGASSSLAAKSVLTIGSPDPVTKKYFIKIYSTGCEEGSRCSYASEAVAYGFGEIVVPINANENCNLLVQQLSVADEWPRLKDGQARVRLNDYMRCREMLKGCEKYVPIWDAILSKEK